MRKERVEAAEIIAEKLFAAEAAIDQALAAAAQLNATIPQASAQARLATAIGQEALEGVCGTISSLIEARSRIVCTHEALDRAKTDIGLRTHAFGGGMLKPFRELNLRVVDSQAA